MANWTDTGYQNEFTRVNYGVKNNISSVGMIHITHSQDMEYKQKVCHAKSFQQQLSMELASSFLVMRRREVIHGGRRVFNKLFEICSAVF